MSFLRIDRELLARFRAGSPDALSQVYWKYVHKVERLLGGGFQIPERGIRVAGACREAEALADLVQETFLRAFSEKGRLGYDGLRDYAPYLYAIARNVLIDHARSQGREIPTPWKTLEEALEINPVQDPPGIWETPAVMEVVAGYLASLQGQIREVHRLRHLEGLSQDEAARQLGVGRQTLRTLELRLRDGLATALNRAGVTPHDQPKSALARTEERGIHGHPME
jgi:RNA polymerase sigma factor (sigma-70 family)